MRVTANRAMEIREERPNDIVDIKRINDLAFNQKHEGKLVEDLRKSGDFCRALSLLYILKGESVGHILFYPVHIQGSNTRHDTFSLAPMAVLPEHQRKGIGSALVNEGLKMLKERHIGSVVVLGHPEYYPRFGFRPASQWGIKCAFPCPDEAFMAVELLPGALNGKTGTVVFPEAFNASM